MHPRLEEEYKKYIINKKITMPIVYKTKEKEKEYRIYQFKCDYILKKIRKTISGSEYHIVLSDLISLYAWEKDELTEDFLIYLAVRKI